MQSIAVRVAIIVRRKASWADLIGLTNTAAAADCHNIILYT